ncbi:hypothetical protein [Bradyrhizobium sp. USDA 4454]
MSKSSPAATDDLALREELARQQEANEFMAREIAALRETVRQMQASRDKDVLSRASEPNYAAPKSAAVGTTLDAGTIRKWCADGEIDCRRLGGRWYVDLNGERTRTRLALFRRV